MAHVSNSLRAFILGDSETLSSAASDLIYKIRNKSNYYRIHIYIEFAFILSVSFIYFVSLISFCAFIIFINFY